MNTTTPSNRVSEGFFFSSRRRHTRCSRDWSSDVCSSDLHRRRRRGVVLAFHGGVVGVHFVPAGVCEISRGREEASGRADTVVAREIPSVYEPSLFGTYSKKIGMWLFLMSDSLTFGALLYAYSYGRISTAGWPAPFQSESIVDATVMTAC